MLKKIRELVTDTSETREKHIKVALVLGGGGVRGIAHLGVLEELEKHNIPIDLIVGTSAGSIVGALYADNPGIARINKLLINLKRKDIMEFSWRSALQFLTQVKAPFSGKGIKDFIAGNIKNTNIEDLAIKFVAVASDVAKGEAYLFDKGPVDIAVQSSSALPPVFTAVKLNNKYLVDGGILEPVPVRVAKMYNPDVVVAVNVTTRGRNIAINNMFNLTYKSLHTMYYHLAYTQAQMADIVIHPDLTEYSVLSDHDNKGIFAIGRQEAQRVMPDLLKLLRVKKISKSNLKQGEKS